MPDQFNVEEARKAGYSDDEILSHLTQTRKFDIAGAEKSGYSKAEIISHLAGTAASKASAPQPKGLLQQAADVGSDIMKGLGTHLNPVTMAKGMIDAANVTNWPQIGSNILEAQGKAGSEAAEAFKQGKYGTAARKGLGYLIPLLGPAMNAAGDKAEDGKVVEGVSEGVGLGLATFGANKLPQAAQVVKAGAKKSIQGIQDFAAKRNIPLSAADVSDNAFIKGGQQVASATLGGSMVATPARAAQSGQMRRVAGELMDEVAPTGASRADAGRSLQSSLEGRKGALEQSARIQYGELDKLEKLPKNQSNVQVGTREVKSGVIDANGNPVVTQVPITEKMAFPTDVRPLKEWAQPILDKLKQRYNPADPESAKNIGQQMKSLQSIVDGPDYKPASVAEKDLSAVKALRRNADVETEATMRGAQELDMLQQSIDDAVSKDPAAIKALQSGRAKWAAKSEVEEIIGKLREEPAQAFEQTSWRKDNGIEFLKRMQKEVPGEMKNLGRAWLEDTFAKSMAEDGLSGGKGLLAKWESLGPETKLVLFDNPAMVKNLDDFFRLAKRIDSPLNTSGTAAATAAGRAIDLVTGGAVFNDGIIPAILGQAGTAGITALMYSPKFVSKLNKGLALPVKSPARAAILGELLEMAKAKASETSQTQRMQPAGAAGRIQ
jgi:hypothetical protein